MTSEELQRDLERCVRCGKCRSVCPVFQETDFEPTVARGKLALLRDYLAGLRVPAEELAAVLSRCLLCKSCAAQCPSGVHGDELIAAGRELLVSRRGLPVGKKVSFSLLQHRRIFDFCLSLATWGQKMGLKRLTGRSTAAVLRFPMPGLTRRRVVAPLAARSLRSQYPPVIKVDQPRRTVALFTGCMVNYIYTDAGRAAIDVLTANRVTVLLPRLQHCCGFPVFTSGDTVRGQLLARHNVQVFAALPVDAIVTLCGSCGSAWRFDYPRLLADDPALRAVAQAMAAKTYDICEFLSDVLPLDADGLGKVDTTVTIHDPCHLARGMGVAKQVRRLVTAVPGVKVVEMAEPGRCCGAGGSFSLAYYDLAREINDHKIADIVHTGADTVLTGCGSCRMHINDGLSQKQQPQQVLHTVELLALAYSAKQRGQTTSQAG